MILLGDCREVMATMEAESVDAVVTDPPYHLTTGKKGGSGEASLNVNSPAGRSRVTTGFMGKAWDGGDVAHDPAVWTEALRVLKPGGHLLAFGGTRTFHRLTCAIEDAGFEIRDCLSWLYGSGFPKSLDVSKAIDKAAGAEREEGVPGPYHNPASSQQWTSSGIRSQLITVPATPEAAKWSGWGTALKPAWEPVILARKPLVGTVAANVTRFGTGAINVDACRIEANDADALAKNWDRVQSEKQGIASVGLAAVDLREYTPSGRWPANVLLSHTPECRETGTRKVKTPPSRERSPDGPAVATWSLGRTGGVQVGHGDPDGTETVAAWTCPESCPVRMLDEQSGETGGGFGIRGAGVSPNTYGGGKGYAGTLAETGQTVGFGDSGGASRFFFTAKADSRDRWITLTCDCQTRIMSAWENADPSQRARTDSTSRGRATSGATSRAESDSNTSLFGSESTDEFPPDSPSTTSTGKSRTTASRISSSSAPLSTNDSTPGASSEMESGGNPADSAESESPSTLRTGISPARDTHSTGDAAPAISAASSRRSACAKCGKRFEVSSHPTVKPTDLMRWLCKLVTPPDGLILDPFCGSGSTGVAAEAEGFRFIGIEQDAEYVEIAKRRIANVAPLFHEAAP